MANQNINQEFSVTGKDEDNTVVEDTTEQDGTLGYDLLVTENVQIGSPVTFQIIPRSFNLIYATVKNCEISVEGRDRMTF